MPFWVAPGASNWNSLLGRIDNAVDNMLDAAETGRENAAQGFLLTSWGDHGHWDAPSVAYGPAVFGGAVSWCLEANRDVDIAAVLDEHVLLDEARLTGGALMRLGRVHRDLAVPLLNGSPIARALFPDPAVPLPSLPPPEALDRVATTLAACRDDLTAAAPAAADGDVVRRELHLAVALAEFALDVLRARAAAGAGAIHGNSDADAVAGADAVDPAAARRLLRRIEPLLPEQDREQVCAGLPGPGRDPAVWEALIRCHQHLFAGPGPDVPSAPPDWPGAPAALGSAGRYFYVHLFVLAVPLALERQRRLGIPDEVVAATFADLGAKLTSYRLGHGTGGFDRQRWTVRHFRGTLHRLGRIQFERGVLDADACGGDAAATGGPAHGDPVLQVHIPEDGPLSRSGCDASFAAAREFHAQHFPGTRHRHATCSSWLLDRQLAGHLPEGSNILAFQRRFKTFGARPVCDDDVLEFVFHAPPGTADLHRLPQGTPLQRNLVRHLRSGGHWRTAHGWTALP